MEAPLHTTDPNYWLVYGDWLEEHYRMRSAVKAREIAAALRWKNKLVLIGSDRLRFVTQISTGRRYYVKSERRKNDFQPPIGWLGETDMELGWYSNSNFRDDIWTAPSDFPWLSKLIVWKFFFTIRKLYKQEQKAIIKAIG